MHSPQTAGFLDSIKFMECCKRLILHPYQESRIDAFLHDSRNSKTAISKMLGKSLTASKNYINRIKFGKETIRTGRPRKLIKRNFWWTPQEAEDKISSCSVLCYRFSLSVTPCGVAQILNDSGAIRFKSMNVILWLKPRHKSKRLTFARDPLTWMLSDWHRVLFNDGKVQPEHAWWLEVLLLFVGPWKKSVHHSSALWWIKMVCSGFSILETTKLVVLAGTQNSKCYKKSWRAIYCILREKMMGTR